MRTPVTMVQADSSVNRLSVSASGLVAIPFDNRNVRIYDLAGNRIARLPRSRRTGHARMACCTAWSDEGKKPNLFTCGFDRVVLGWNVRPREVKDELPERGVAGSAAGRGEGQSGMGGAGGGGDVNKLGLSLKGAKDFHSLKDAQSNQGGD